MLGKLIFWCGNFLEFTFLGGGWSLRLLLGIFKWLDFFSLRNYWRQLFEVLPGGKEICIIWGNSWQNSVMSHLCLCQCLKFPLHDSIKKKKKSKEGNEWGGEEIPVSCSELPRAFKHSLWGSQRNPPLKLDLWEPCKRLCVRAGLASCIFSSKIIFLFLFMNGVIFLSVGMINRRGNTLSLNLQKEWPEYLLRGRERGPSLFAPFCAACSPPWGMAFFPGQEFLAPLPRLPTGPVWVA